MTLPIPAVTAAFASGNANIAQYAKDDSFSLSRGTSSVVTTGFVADAGTYTTSLNNFSRRFDPNNLAGPYVSSGPTTDLVPGVGVAVTETWAATSHPLFTGRIDDWPLTYPNLGVAPVVPLAATDFTNLFANVNFVGNRPAELTGARIQAILAAVGYAGPTGIDIGNTLLGPLVSSGAIPAWSTMVDCCSAEWGDLYFAADGTLRFRDRNTILSETRSNTSQATFGGVGNLRYSGITMRSPPIVNDCTVQWNDTGGTVNAQDPTSQARSWGKRSNPALTLPFAAAMAAQMYCNWVVYRYANPVTVPGSISFKPTRTDNTGAGVNDLWPQALGRELGDRITVVTPSVAGGDSFDCWIRGIQHDYSSHDWTTTFFLEDARWSATIARYDVSVYDDSPAKVYGL